MIKKRAVRVLQILKETLALPNWTKYKRDPFETLLVTVISQNTTSRNTARAFEALSKRFGISPEALANAEISQIELAIRTAGLYKAKAQTIQHAAKIILGEYGGSMQPILQTPHEAARKILMQFSGIGPKTADVVLLFCAGQPTIPVDTHVNRVAKRLGFASEKGDYETVRCSLQALYEPADYLVVHLLFIAHGRKICKAPRPLCTQCPINACCPTNGKWGNP